MKKGSFIPKDFRPIVPGSKLKTSNQSVNRIKFLQEISENCILFLSSKDDIVPDYFLRDIDHKNAVMQLYYDDLGTIWDFSYSDRVLKIFAVDKVIIPISIYHRHPGISLDHPYYQKHIAFFEILDIWKGELLGQKRDHYQNFSKGYQGITSIRTSSSLNRKEIRHPKSFFVKGDFRLLTEKLKDSLIVKSCSNMRSKVVSEEIFSDWDFNNLNNLPTLFQEKIIGMDIRVHVCGNEVWSLQVENKDYIDYRYASKGSVTYKEIQLPYFIKDFCRSIARVEKNRFIGVDLIKSNNKYYCLESNPGPGWSTYHHPSKKIFAKKVFKQLLRK